MNISLTLVHNKTAKANEAQIAGVRALLDEVTEEIDGLDEEGNIIPNAFIRTYYVFKGLDLPHEVTIQHIIPYQPLNKSNPYNAVLPSNMSLLKGRNVQYGKGDEDKTGDHPRFFNWSLKRGTDNGADINIYLEDYTKFDVNNLAIQLNSLIDPEDKHEYAEDSSVKLASAKLLMRVGQLDETKSKAQAIADLKTRNVEEGFKNG